MNTAEKIAPVAAEILPHVDPELQDLRARHDAERDASDNYWDVRDRHKAERAALTPRVGMGATWHGYSDSHACTIVEIRRNGREIVLREDTATLLNGAGSDASDALHFEPGGFAGHTSGTQRWALTSNPEGQLHRFSRRVVKTSHGEIIRWVRVGEKANGTWATLGHRAHHYDFNF